MADRIARYSMLGAAPLSKRALRIGDLWHCDAYCDLYTMFDGKAVPFSWASDSWLDTHTLAEGTDMYIVHRRWRDLPTKPEFEVLIFDFKSESAIEEWFRDFNLFTRQRDSTAVSNVERLGDDSRLYRNMNEDGASDFVEAQRIVVRIGLQAFTIFLSASKCFATDVLVGLVRLQLERLGGASVGGSVPFPQELL